MKIVQNIIKYFVIACPSMCGSLCWREKM